MIFFLLFLVLSGSEQILAIGDNHDTTQHTATRRQHQKPVRTAEQLREEVLMSTVHDHYFETEEGMPERVAELADSFGIDYEEKRSGGIIAVDQDSDNYREFMSARVYSDGTTVRQTLGQEFHNWDQVERRLGEQSAAEKAGAVRVAADGGKVENTDTMADVDHTPPTGMKYQREIWK